MGNFFLYIGCAVVADWATRQVFGNKPLFEVKTETVETDEKKEEAAE